MEKKQSNRLTEQHKKTQGVVGIFGEEAHQHDTDVFRNSCVVKNRLEEEFQTLSFRYRQLGKDLFKQITKNISSI